MAYHFWEPAWTDFITEPVCQYRIVSEVREGDARLQALHALKRQGYEFSASPIDPGLFELVPDTPITDVLIGLNDRPRTMVISDKLKLILDQFDIFDHRCHQLQMRASWGEVQLFWLLEWRDDVIPHIDFSRSRFSKVEMMSRAPAVAMNIASFQEYESLRKELILEAPQRYWRIQGDLITFVSAGFKGKDMFDLGAIRAFPPGLVISDGLMAALLDAQITGVRFRTAHIQDR